MRRPAACQLPDLVAGHGAFTDGSALNAWELYSRTNCAATKELDGGTAKIAVTRSAGDASGVQFTQSNVAVTAGTQYTLSFRARADTPLTMQAVVEKAATPYTTYMAADDNDIPLTTEWRTFEYPLTSSATDPAAVLVFSLGKSVGTVWIDDIKLQEGDRNVYRRDYEGGVALVNATSSAVTVNLGGTFRKIKGTQDPLVNDGSLVTAVTIPAKDGLVLLRPTPAEKLRMPVHRFFNRRNGSHFYTADANEQVRVLTTLSATYSYDGIAYTVNTANTANNSPLYRFYNKKDGSHFYTASESEKKAILARLSATYSLDGPAYKVCLTPVTGATTVYRFYNKMNGSHFYTASESEKKHVLTDLSATYSLDGPAFYVAP